MRKYFLKLYSETGKKPYTFLNFLLCIIFPLIPPIAIAHDDKDGVRFLILLFVTLGVCWIINTILHFKNFKSIGKAILLTLLNFFASIWVFCRLILFPLIKVCSQLSLGMANVQTGNFTGAGNDISRAGASAKSVKMSALNWFKYDGTTYQDIHVEPELTEEQEYNQWRERDGEFSIEENRKAVELGYINGAHAKANGTDVSMQ